MPGPGHCDLVTLPVLQAPDTSTACADFDTWQTAHPNQSWYENPWSSTSYRGAPGYVVGLTARNETACCQGKPPPSSPCVGACPCGPTNILHCGRYDSNDRCVAVEQCEVPGTYRWVAEEASLTPTTIGLVSAAAVVVVVVGILIAYKCKRRAISRSMNALAMQPAGMGRASEGAYVSLP